jgi:hypothetical protein
MYPNARGWPRRLCCWINFNIVLLIFLLHQCSNVLALIIFSFRPQELKQSCRYMKLHKVTPQLVFRCCAATKLAHSTLLKPTSSDMKTCTQIIVNVCVFRFVFWAWIFAVAREFTSLPQMWDKVRWSSNCVVCCALLNWLPSTTETNKVMHIKKKTCTWIVEVRVFHLVFLGLDYCHCYKVN